MLGKVVKDKVTGFVGVVTARVEYLHSTPSVRLESEVDGENKTKDLWIDEARAEVIEAA